MEQVDEGGGGSEGEIEFADVAYAQQRGDDDDDPLSSASGNRDSLNNGSSQASSRKEERLLLLSAHLYILNGSAWQMKTEKYGSLSVWRSGGSSSEDGSSSALVVRIVVKSDSGELLLHSKLSTTTDLRQAGEKFFQLTDRGVRYGLRFYLVEDGQRFFSLINENLSSLPQEALAPSISMPPLSGTTLSAGSSSPTHSSSMALTAGASSVAEGGFSVPAVDLSSISGGGGSAISSPSSLISPGSRSQVSTPTSASSEVITELSEERALEYYNILKKFGRFRERKINKKSFKQTLSGMEAMETLSTKATDIRSKYDAGVICRILLRSQLLSVCVGDEIWSETGIFKLGDPKKFKKAQKTASGNIKSARGSSKSPTVSSPVVSEPRMVARSDEYNKMQELAKQAFAGLDLPQMSTVPREVAESRAREENERFRLLKLKEEEEKMRPPELSMPEGFVPASSAQDNTQLPSLSVETLLSPRGGASAVAPSLSASVTAAVVASVAAAAAYTAAVEPIPPKSEVVEESEPAPVEVVVELAAPLFLDAPLAADEQLAAAQKTAFAGSAIAPEPVTEPVAAPVVTLDLMMGGAMFGVAGGGVDEAVVVSPRRSDFSGLRQADAAVLLQSMPADGGSVAKSDVEVRATWQKFITTLMSVSGAYLFGGGEALPPLVQRLCARLGAEELTLDLLEKFHTVPSSTYRAMLASMERGELPEEEFGSLSVTQVFGLLRQHCSERDPLPINFEGFEPTESFNSTPDADKPAWLRTVLDSLRPQSRTIVAALLALLLRVPVADDNDTEFSARISAIFFPMFFGTRWLDYRKAEEVMLTGMLMI
jgi:hypothetical protein